MFFVDDDETQIPEGSENRGSRSDDDPLSAPVQAHPFRESLIRGHPAVKNRDPFCRKIPPELSESLSRQGDLGNQKNRVFTLIQTVADQPEVDLRLAASGHSVEKVRLESGGFHIL